MSYESTPHSKLSPDTERRIGALIEHLHQELGEDAFEITETSDLFQIHRGERITHITKLDPMSVSRDGRHEHSTQVDLKDVIEAEIRFPELSGMFEKLEALEQLRHQSV